MAETLTYTVVLEPQAEGGFTVVVPALPEVVTEGDTEDEALAMVTEAIQLALDYRRENHLPIPEDTAPRVKKGAVASAS